jgi:DNA-binding transcriptional ArsR family regulator
MNNMNIDEYTKIFATLSHPLRLKIACGLKEKGRCNVNTMMLRLNVSQALVSQHVKILKEANVITGTREGNIIWYSLSSELTKQILNCIDTICNDQ